MSSHRYPFNDMLRLSNEDIKFLLKYTYEDLMKRFNELASPLRFFQIPCSTCLANRLNTLMRKYKTSRKNIADPPNGFIELSIDETLILDTCVLQRLREINQMSFLYSVSPSARHSRFEHSLGVLNSAKLIYNSLVSKGDITRFFRDLLKKYNVQDYLEQIEIPAMLTFLEGRVVSYAALLHDIGHFPFSHLGESIFYILSHNKCKNLSCSGYPGDFSELDNREIHELSRRLGFNKIYGDEKGDILLHLIFSNGSPHEVKSFLLITSRNIDGRDNEFRVFLERLMKFWVMKFVSGSLNKSIFSREVENTTNKITDMLSETPYKIDEESLVTRIGSYILRDDLDVILLSFLFEFYNREDRTSIFKRAIEFWKWSPIHSIINGNWIDADKLDYLLRDSYFTGFYSLNIEINRLINGLRLSKVSHLKQYKRDISDKIIQRFGEKISSGEKPNNEGYVREYELSIERKYKENIGRVISQREFLKMAFHLHPMNRVIELLFKRGLDFLGRKLEERNRERGYKITSAEIIEEISSYTDRELIERMIRSFKGTSNDAVTRAYILAGLKRPRLPRKILSCTIVIDKDCKKSREVCKFLEDIWILTRKFLKNRRLKFKWGILKSGPLAQDSSRWFRITKPPLIVIITPAVVRPKKVPLSMDGIVEEWITMGRHELSIKIYVYLEPIGCMENVKRPKRGIKCLTEAFHLSKKLIEYLASEGFRYRISCAGRRESWNI